MGIVKGSDWYRRIRHLKDLPHIAVEMDRNECRKLDDFIKKYAESKGSETTHIIDGRFEEIRATNGNLAEHAVRCILGMRGIDRSIGESRSFNRPDLWECGIGIKTGRVNPDYNDGNFPLVSLRSCYPEIICSSIDERATRGYYTVNIYGIATPDVLLDYSSFNYVWDENVIQRRVKRGFYGHDYIIPTPDEGVLDRECRRLSRICMSLEYLNFFD